MTKKKKEEIENIRKKLEETNCPFEIFDALKEAYMVDYKSKAESMLGSVSAIENKFVETMDLWIDSLKASKGYNPGKIQVLEQIIKKADYEERFEILNKMSKHLRGSPEMINMYATISKNKFEKEVGLKEAGVILNDIMEDYFLTHNIIYQKSSAIAYGNFSGKVKFQLTNEKDANIAYT